MGYNTDSITKGKFNAIGINWVGTDGKGFQLNSINGEALHGAVDGNDADRIQIWNPSTSGYEYWYYYVNESDHSYDGWWDYPNGTTEFSETHPNGLANGSAVWFLSHSDSSGGNATLSGAVDSSSTVTLTLVKGKFNQIANPFPVGLQLNNSDQVTWENATGAVDGNDADRIQIWNPATSGYEYWYYYVNASDHSYDGWWDYPNGTTEFSETHPNGLDVGTPVWYLAAGTFGETFDVTFKTPVK